MVSEQTIKGKGKPGKTKNSAKADNLSTEAALMEIKDVTLSAVLGGNPEAKQEYDAALAKAKEDGVAEGIKAGEETVKARIKGCIPFLTSDKYPQPIRDLAVKVLNDEEALASLTVAASAHDVAVEAVASVAAQTQTDSQGETVQDDGHEVSTDGIIRNDDDMAAAVARVKGEEV